MNIVCFGAHPDDGEVYAGGTSVLWAGQGHRVVLVSMTNGDAGHQEMARAPLARRRAAEALDADQRAGVTSLVLDYPDGELEPTLAARKRVVEIIRRYEADIVLTHRPNDYHPDHRYTSIIVQDAAFMVTVPHFCPEAPALTRNPLFLFLMDSFKKPAPFQPDIAVDVTAVMDVKWSMLDAMESQMYEWLPWLGGTLASVPEGKTDRLRWLMKTWDAFFTEPAKLGQRALERWYGKERAAEVRYAELFEICEYGGQPSPEEIRRLFPFFPA